ncbi:sulfurtransferase [Leeuwenhoekiella nanhaiensis]|uniref:Rhodanese domain-containing protein n=1 Tax=Leeuwenhoekiella nanhaiensis TaxID=1655491 RepID=A0A2G1VQ69_9FLAO|nr:sulfurtransferase [Leeuwenhoekiella nanhaiensis]PHQ28917.1 hypothetical protein CJ305_12030 [Leeuwenhoekiella nanhaiensis]
MQRSTLIAVKELSAMLDDPDLVLLDCSLKKTASGKEFDLKGKTIPGARFFDLENTFSDAQSDFPNTLPQTQDFERRARALGINTDSKLVVFDAGGMYSSPRVWWMFQVMGNRHIRVLNGGLPAWNEAGFPLAEGFETDFEEGNFKAAFDHGSVKSFQDIEQNTDAQKFTLVDARSSGRFKGIDPEPRPHLQSGSIPQSVNFPFQDVLENGKFKSKTELYKLFEERSLLTDKLVYSCGSGLTACIIMLAGQIAAQKGIQLYDGSWTEWAELKKMKK